jgi:hypothetical protein
MAQNKLKRKVEALTNVVRELIKEVQTNASLAQGTLTAFQLIKEVQTNASLAQGTLTAFQLHIGKDEWNKLVEELKNVEERRVQEDKKLEIPKDVE